MEANMEANLKANMEDMKQIDGNMESAKMICGIESNIKANMEDMKKMNDSMEDIKMPCGMEINMAEAIKKHDKIETRGVGKRLTDLQRVQILEAMEQDKTLKDSEIARQYGVTKSAIGKLKRNRDVILKRYREGNGVDNIEYRGKRQRGSNGNEQHMAFEKALYNWIMEETFKLKVNDAFCLQNETTATIPLANIRTKAREMAEDYQLKQFKASVGWYYRFCTRFQILTGKEKMPLTRRILITGCDQGIGLALAYHFKSQGWQVIAAVRNAETSFSREVRSYKYIYIYILWLLKNS